jgi:hypothetical protein
MGMRCVRCGTDNDLRDRTNNFGRCKNCNHPFAFEPSTVRDTNLNFTDPFFAKAIDDISANNTLSFTPKQFSYFLDRRLKKRIGRSGFGWLFFFIFFNVWATLFFGGFLSFILRGSSFIIASIVTNTIFIVTFFNYGHSRKVSDRTRKANARNLQIVGGMILAGGTFFSLEILQSFPIFAAYVILGMTSIFLGTRQKIRQSTIAEEFLFEQNQFQDWIDRWVAANGTINKMLPSPRETSNPVRVNPEVSAYSFDRLVVTDSTAIAQLLIANNFHFENNCAILSITGYPQNIFSTVMEMLRRNPELKVYAIHDASPRGVSLVHNLRTSPQWFQNSNIEIFDLGLLPRQILASRNMYVRNSDESAQTARQLPSAVRQSLSQAELVWLDNGNFVELESFTPQRIIRVLNLGIAQSQNPQNDALILLEDTGMYDGGGYIFTADTFG